MGERLPPPRDATLEVEVEPDTGQIQIPPPRPTPSPPPPPRRASTEPAQQAPLPAKTEAAWRTEVDIMRREAEALRERDPTKAALFYGTIAQVATSVLADNNTAVAALHAASQLLPGTG